MVRRQFMRGTGPGNSIRECLKSPGEKSMSKTNEKLFFIGFLLNFKLVIVNSFYNSIFILNKIETIFF